MTAFVALLGCLSAFGSMCPTHQSSLLPNPADPAARGPYPVSASLLPGTFTSRNLTVEVFFPARPGSEARPGVANFSLDVRDFLPPDIGARVKPALVPHPAYPGMYVGLPPAWQPPPPTTAPHTTTTTTAPAAAAAAAAAGAGRGFPAIVFVHGTAGWRSQSLSLASHWASRGFVVIAADYPGIRLYDLLDLAAHPLKPGHPKTDQVGDTRKLVAELAAMSDPRLVEALNTPPGAVDLGGNGGGGSGGGGGGGAAAADGRAAVGALIGHSAGALALAHLSDLATVIVPMAGDGAQSGHATLRSTLLLGAANDTEVPPRSHQEPAYLTTPAPKRLVVGRNMGHQAFSDLCYIGEKEGGIAGIGEKSGIWEAFAFAPLARDGCSFYDPGFFEPAKNWGLIEFATAAVLEETLRCDASMGATFDTIATRFDFVADIKQNLG
jgi:hypothetical protein